MRYEVVVFSEKWDIGAVFFVGMVGVNRLEMPGGNNFHPGSSCYTTHCNCKLINPSTSKAVSSLHTYSISQYLLTLNHHNHVHHLLTAGSNSSLRARGHVKCWLEFHPVSLSEGWFGDFLLSILKKSDQNSPAKILHPSQFPECRWRTKICTLLSKHCQRMMSIYWPINH